MNKITYVSHEPINPEQDKIDDMIIQKRQFLLSLENGFTHDIPDDLKNDKDFFKEILNKFKHVSQLQKCLDKASDNILNDIELARLYAKINGGLLPYFSDEIRDNKGFFLDNIFCVIHASDRLKDDEELAIMCLNKGRSYFLKFFSDRIKDNKEVITKAIKHDYCLFKHASERLQHDKDVLKLYFNCLLKQKISEDSFEIKMLKRLEILEEEEYLNSIMPVNKKTSKPIKF